MKNILNIKVIIADDHEIFREGLQMILCKEPGITVIGGARNGKELMEMIAKEKPDVVLTDIVMPEMSGVDAARMISTAYPEIGIIALSMYSQECLVMEMLAAGAIGYLLKNTAMDEILEAIHSAHMLTPYYARNASVNIARLHAKVKQKTNDHRTEFTSKEKEIISFICEGFTNREIGKRMFLSKRTVDCYRSKILDKMHVKSTAGIVTYAIRNSLFKLENPFV
jgi:two-component system, NarL family, response regulator NreC